MWTTVRAVEIMSYKAFDDSVSCIQPTMAGFIIGMTSELIQFSLGFNKIMIITPLPELILGFLSSEASFYVATKSSISLAVYQGFFNNLTAFNSSYIDVSSECRSFFAQPLFSSFWFGLDDGTIIGYSVDKSFVPKVSLKSSIILICRTLNQASIFLF
jgi:hypothetical protein